MSKHYDYALMSDFVYKLGGEKYKDYDKYPGQYKNEKDYLDYENQKSELLSRGWVLVSTSQQNNIGIDVNYFGAAFKHKETNQIVIAHRGTVTGTRNVEAAILVMSGQIPKFIILPCFKYIAHINKQFPNHKLTMTGHSLGGYLASMGVITLNALGRATKATTFDSIGVRTYLQQFRKEWRKTYRQNVPLNEIAQSIVNYLSSPNIINTSIEQVGRNRRLFLKNDSTDSIRAFLLPIVQKNERNNELLRSLDEPITDISTPTNLLDLMTTWLYSHPMANFLSAIDKNYGVPQDNYGEITRWPSRNSSFFQRNPEYNMINSNNKRSEKFIRKVFEQMTAPEVIEQNIIPIVSAILNNFDDRLTQDENFSENAKKNGNNINYNP